MFIELMFARANVYLIDPTGQTKYTVVGSQSLV